VFKSDRFNTGWIFSKIIVSATSRNRDVSGYNYNGVY